MSPLVLVPGIQGRWEWLGPAIRSLGRTHEVLTFSLGEGRGGDLFESWTATIDRLIARSGQRRAVVVGISFGGVVASYYAGHRPANVSALVLVSAPSPRWAPDRQVTADIAHPWRALPRFALRASTRLTPEVITAIPSWPGRVGFGLGYAYRSLRSPVNPAAMANWVRAWVNTDIVSACRSITAPTLVITGEPELDRIVPVASTLEYLDLIAGSEHVTLAKTGHVGVVSKPDAFAKIVADFARRVGAAT
jgi:pimeloyl-ACP methyl ester carboxylesterase